MFVVKMEFDGKLDRDAITNALPLALSRHPLLQANVKPAKGKRLTISIFTYRRVLKICLRCDPKYFTVANSRAFLAHYVAAISNLA